MKKQIKINNGRYVLAVKDLAKSAKYYEEQLGFSTWWSGEGWHFLKREKFMVMLGECPTDRSAHETKNHSYFAYIDVENIDELYAEFQSKKVEILAGVADKPWGQREFSIRTIDGHRIMFGEEILETKNDQDKNGETTFKHLSPVLASADVARDIAWYEQKLGFKNVYDSSAYQEGPIDYAVVGRQNLFLHLQFQFPNDMTSTDIRFQVQNIDPLFEEYVSKGLLTRDKINRKTAWHTCEFGLFDPSRNRITFFEDL